MKIQDLKIGDIITHYCSGEIVEGKIIAISENFVISHHKKITWGNDVYENSTISKSTYLQNPDGNRPTTPGAWYKSKKLQS